MLVLATPSGPALDLLIGQVAAELTPGDVLVDFSNSHYVDTTRRVQQLAEDGILFLGAGVSGGDGTGGPAIAVGGHPEGWMLAADMLRSIAGRSADGKPFCVWVGEGGAGHFVKMVHNGIEYADMQSIAEAYHLMRDALSLESRDLRGVFAQWAGSELDAYLVSITADILDANAEDGTPLLDHILDVADQHGTGAWTVAESLELRVPATLVAAAVHARSLSALKGERLTAAESLYGPGSSFGGSRAGLLDDLAQALVATRIVSYTQAFFLLRQGSRAHRWDINLTAVAAMWQGSIIRSALLNDVRDAFASDPELSTILLDDRLRERVVRSQASWRRVVATAADIGVPTPTISAALTFYDGFRAPRLPANLLQAQRDYFASHGYERLDRERGTRFHTDWPRGAQRTS
jgi:6-phosphogluconate dehydrogenase